MVQNPIRPRRFAPLDPAKQKEGDERAVLKGIVFDVDGTLCEFPFPCVKFGAFEICVIAIGCRVDFTFVCIPIL
jgi:hypothetical protein